MSDVPATNGRTLKSLIHRRLFLFLGLFAVALILLWWRRNPAWDRRPVATPLEPDRAGNVEFKIGNPSLRDPAHIALILQWVSPGGWERGEPLLLFDDQIDAPDYAREPVQDSASDQRNMVTRTFRLAPGEYDLTAYEPSLSILCEHSIVVRPDPERLFVIIQFVENGEPNWDGFPHFMCETSYQPFGFM